MKQTKKREKENDLEKQRQLKRQSQLRQTLKRLICELDAENFDYKSWITNNKSEPSEYESTESAQSAPLNDDLDCSYGDDMMMNGAEFDDDDFDDDSALSETSDMSKGKKMAAAAARKSPTIKSHQAPQRRRCSNSLSISAIKASTSGKSAASLGQPQAPTTLNYVRLTNLKQNDILTHQNQQQQSLASTSSSNRQRHVSCDESMIMNKQRRKRNSSSMNFGTTDSMADMMEDYDDEDLYDDTEDNSSNDLEEAIENARLKAAAAAASAAADDDDDDSSTNELVINEEDMQTDGSSAPAGVVTTSAAESIKSTPTSVSPVSQALFAKKKRGRPSGGRNSFSSTSSTASTSKKLDDAIEQAVSKRSPTPTTFNLPTMLTANIPSPQASQSRFNFGSSGNSNTPAKCEWTFFSYL